jgi:NAD(P)-dependent dehydrogenase (short-subunit alcohol dehydrogenase family)
MLDRGARVVVPSRTQEKLERLRAAVGQHGEQLLTIQGDIGDERAAGPLLEQIASQVGHVDAAVATLGHFVAAPSVLAASTADLERVIEGYLLAHFVVARTLIPALSKRGGSYTFINGPLAFRPMYPGTGLVSIVTAAQAMLARVTMQELATSTVRVNEVVLHTPFGWGDGDGRRGALPQEEVGRYVALLVSSRGSAVRGQTIQLDSPERFAEVGGATADAGL